MKKIININLSGRVIPIEDSAYEKLQSYIESLRRYFAREEGRDEIINDIESRIAELMNEKVRKGASSVTDADIEEIIASMGRPEDFDAEDAAQATAEIPKQRTQQEHSAGPEKERKGRGRLYRDSGDKFIGGVCSGLANYLHTDPAIVRILFAIVTFGGFGLGFVVYILLWMILPDKDLENYSGKRLYRNPEDKIIGGVAGGLAAYFNSRASIVRLIFAAPIILSIFLSLLDDWDFFPNIIFGSLSGTFILAYVILWMVLPEARSAYEKMEMRGEKVDVNTIRQNVKEGMENVKDRAKSWGEEVKESAQNMSSKAKEFANTRGKTFAKEVNDTARNSGRGIGHAIGVLFKAFFLFIFGTIAFALFVAVMTLIFGGIAWWPVNDFLWTSKWQQAYAWGTLIFFLLVPLVGFITWVIRRILRVRSQRSYLGWTFGFLWTIGWVCAILLVASISRDFSTYRSADIIINTAQPANDKMIVVASQPELEYTGNFSWINDDSEGWDLSSDTLKLATVSVPDPQKSPDSLYHVIMRKFSYGRNTEDAINRAEKIQYSVSSMDSVLDLSSAYAIDKDSKFRGQQIVMEIQVPAGKKIRFDETVITKLKSGSFRVKRTYRRRGSLNIEINDHYPRGFRANIDYTMGIDGKLKDPSGKTVNDNYRYYYDEQEPKEPSTEELRKKAKEAQEKLKQREDEDNKKKEKNKSKSDSVKQESMDDTEDALANNSHSIFSIETHFF